uniref:Uncharacterized protein n=1 Tax=Romanomermis culicivorax TaxID=13658 RepID=A0A915I2J6_ROMCU
MIDRREIIDKLMKRNHRDESFHTLFWFHYFSYPRPLISSADVILDANGCFFDVKLFDVCKVTVALKHLPLEKTAVKSLSSRFWSKSSSSSSSFFFFSPMVTDKLSTGDLSQTASDNKFQLDRNCNPVSADASRCRIAALFDCWPTLADTIWQSFPSFFDDIVSDFYLDSKTSFQINNKESRKAFCRTLRPHLATMVIKNLMKLL